MKKGFTLIELLAVIAILAVIILIASNIVLNVLENSKIEAYKNNEKMFVKAAETYLANNQLMLPALNSKTEISLDTLKTNKFITAIKDPKDNSDCTGYIVVSNIEGNFVYTPHLRCDTTANNSSEDNLVLHYTFDDFQEPTVNLISYDGSFETSSGTHIGNIANSNATSTSISGGWRCSTHYNDGICSIENGGVDGNKFVRWTHSATTGWRAFTSNGFSVEANKPYTVSVYTRINRSDYGQPVAAYGFYGPAGYRYYLNWEKAPNLYINEWVRGTYTFTPDINTSGSVYLYGSSNISDGLTIDYDAYQAEQKPYATPYVNGSRVGIIKNYVGSSYDINLPLSTTPRWINKSYEFDGVNDYFQIPNFNLTSNIFTLNLFINPSSSGSNAGMFVTPNSNGVDQRILYDYTNSRIGISLASSSDTNERTLYTNVNSLEKDKWSMLTFMVNNQNIKVFINGKLQLESEETLPIGLWNDIWHIGQRGNDTNYFKGNIDDIRLYKRTLTNSEIEAIYNSKK